jgi:oxygen-independent coproporphyrinogen-3 oxidase
MRAGDTRVSHGVALDDDERRRRLVILSLLYDGVEAGLASKHFPDAHQALLAEGCAVEQHGVLRLTALGVKHADVVGRLFFSEQVRDLMGGWEYDE